MARERLVKVVSPKGIARYPHLAQPDLYKGKLEFKTDLILDPADEGVTEYIQKLTAAADKAFTEGLAEMKEQAKTAKGKPLKTLQDNIEGLSVKYPFEPEYDDEAEETGRFIVKHKCLAGGVYKAGPKEGKKWTKDLTIFDTQKNKLDRDELVLWGGSVIRIQSEMNPYCMGSTGMAGVSLRLFSVQVIELSGGGDNGDGFGVEDGYVGEPVSKDKKPAAATPDAGDEDDGDEEDF